MAEVAERMKAWPWVVSSTTVAVSDSFVGIQVLLDVCGDEPCRYCTTSMRNHGCGTQASQWLRIKAGKERNNQIIAFVQRVKGNLDPLLPKDSIQNR